ncbi:7677_t:CDS:2, partial [Acaulospora colombiana]
QELQQHCFSLWAFVEVRSCLTWLTIGRKSEGRWSARIRRICLSAVDVQPAARLGCGKGLVGRTGSPALMETRGVLGEREGCETVLVFLRFRQEWWGGKDEWTWSQRCYGQNLRLFSSTRPTCTARTIVYLDFRSLKAGNTSSSALVPDDISVIYGRIDGIKGQDDANREWAWCPHTRPLTLLSSQHRRGEFHQDTEKHCTAEQE